ncbi:GNAT family N-acetyltransferase [Alkalicoccus daliensis]|uniref:Predicted N-acetyltransferase YhbS n=1 Tax=Alkalicoccus daliensis TaxID=745820 RepID=A0A1H0K0I0_9BACI|nr:GNAT family N-acetyltransferase [Alkalicoccus daliensis]SDO49447.1 Predicted N-acetyltransferase YhbS [Alkalicoccus daliensis]
MIIKEASPEDAEIIQYLMRQAFQVYNHENPPSGALKETIEEITMALINGHRALIAYENQKPVGVVRFSAEEEGWYFSRLSVLPEKQGRGIAKQLVDRLEQLALEEENTYLYCKVRKSAQKNIALYETWGYELFHEEIIHKPGGIQIEAVSMEKTLAARKEKAR